MEIPPPQRLLFLTALGGVLAGAALGYLVREDAPAAGAANPSAIGRKNVALTAVESRAAPVRVEAVPGEAGVAGVEAGTVDFVAGRWPDRLMAVR